MEEVHEGDSGHNGARVRQLAVADSDGDAACTVPAHLADLATRSCDGLSDEDAHKVRSLLHSYADVFSSSDTDIGRTNVVKHSIRLKDGAQPIKQRPYRHPPAQEEEIERQVQQMHKDGLICEGKGPCTGPSRYE